MKAYVAEREGILVPETFRLWRYQTVRALAAIEGRPWEQLRAENRGRSRFRKRYRVLRLEVREAVPEPIGGRRS